MLDGVDQLPDCYNSDRSSSIDLYTVEPLHIPTVYIPPSSYTHAYAYTVMYIHTVHVHVRINWTLLAATFVYLTTSELRTPL